MSAAQTASTAASTPDLAWRLRPARLEDARALHADCMPEMESERVHRLVEQGQRAARNQRGLGLVVALPDGRLVGFGQVTLWPRAAEISDVTVGLAWRSRGIGTALILTLAESAHRLGAGRAEIGVSGHNPAALRLYRRLGFVPGRTLTLDLGAGPEPVTYLWQALPIRPINPDSPASVGPRPPG